MPKQTRLSFSKQPTTASKRRKSNSDDETDEQNERPSQRLKTTSSSKPSHKDAENQKSPVKKSSQAKTTPSLDAKPTTPPSRSTTQTKTKSATTTNQTLQVTHHTSSLFLAPPHTLLCHATNAQGTWGAGIALAFKKSYPSAFKIYTTHCSKWPSSALLGTTLLIPPQHKSPSKTEREAQHWIGCLFTSEKKGKGKGSKESILEATGEAVGDLVRKVGEVDGVGVEGEGEGVGDGSGKGGDGNSGGKGERIGEVRMCKINSGLFGVPWEATREVIEGVEVGEGDLEEIAVYSLD